MIIAMISDTHCQHPYVPSADLLIHSGDLTGSGGPSAFEQEMEWLERIKPNYPKGIIYVPGNHDRGLDPEVIARTHERWNKDPYHSYPPTITLEVRDQILQQFKDMGVTVLMDEGCEIDGIKFWGCPYTPEFMDWAFMRTELRLQAHWDKIPIDTTVLISHGPPKYILDWCPGGGNVGSQSLANFVAAHPNIKLHQFGHIHEGGGYRVEGGKMYVNASSLDGSYRRFNPTHVIDTDTWGIVDVVSPHSP